MNIIGEMSKMIAVNNKVELVLFPENEDELKAYLFQTSEGHIPWVNDVWKVAERLIQQGADIPLIAELIDCGVALIILGNSYVSEYPDAECQE